LVYFIIHLELQLDTKDIFVGTASDKKDNTDYFYGLISNIEIYDIALTQEEILENYKSPHNPRLRNNGDFKSSEFLFCQILPELSTINKGVDLSGEHDVYLNNIYLYKDTYSYKTFLPTPIRRNSRFLSLKHKTNSSVGNRWIHNETRKNQIKYYNKVREGIDDFRIDGLNTLRFKEIQKEETDLITKISIEL